MPRVGRTPRLSASNRVRPIDIPNPDPIAALVTQPRIKFAPNVAGTWEELVDRLDDTQGDLSGFKQIFQVTLGEGGGAI